MSQRDAYIQAGYSPVEATANASILLKTNKNVRTLYQQKMAALDKRTTEDIEDAIMSRAEIQARLSDIARANMVDFLDGDKPTLSSKIKHNSAAREYAHTTRYDKQGNPVVTKALKLSDPIDAMRELAKIQGYYAPTRHMVAERVNIEVSFVPKTKGSDVDNQILGASAPELSVDHNLLPPEGDRG
jgi:hypothetical protein